MPVPGHRVLAGLLLPVLLLLGSGIAGAESLRTLCVRWQGETGDHEVDCGDHSDVQNDLDLTATVRETSPICSFAAYGSTADLETLGVGYPYIEIVNTHAPDDRVGYRVEYHGMAPDKNIYFVNEPVGPFRDRALRNRGIDLYCSGEAGQHDLAACARGICAAEYPGETDCDFIRYGNSCACEVPHTDGRPVELGPSRSRRIADCHMPHVYADSRCTVDPEWNCNVNFKPPDHNWCQSADMICVVLVGQGGTGGPEACYDLCYAREHPDTCRKMGPADRAGRLTGFEARITGVSFDYALTCSGSGTACINRQDCPFGESCDLTATWLDLNGGIVVPESLVNECEPYR